MKTTTDHVLWTSPNNRYRIEWLTITLPGKEPITGYFLTETRNQRERQAGCLASVTYDVEDVRHHPLTPHYVRLALAKYCPTGAQ